MARAPATVVSSLGPWARVRWGSLSLDAKTLQVGAVGEMWPCGMSPAPLLGRRILSGIGQTGQAGYHEKWQTDQVESIPEKSLSGPLLPGMAIFRKQEKQYLENMSENEQRYYSSGEKWRDVV